MTDNLFVDVAYHEDLIDWQRAYAAGVREAYIRFATGYKRGAADPLFLINCEGAARAGVRWSVYHVPAITDRDGIRGQAVVFGRTVVVLGRVLGLMLANDLPPMMDLEKFQSLRRDTNRAAIWEYVDITTQVIGAFLGEYTRASWRDSVLGRLPLGFEKDTCLWLAQPGLGGIATTRPPTIPLAYQAVGKTWDIHQYSWKGRIDGIPGEVDLNRRRVVV